jgi:hypothetical protein
MAPPIAEPYLDFKNYGIPDLTISFNNFFRVVFNIEYGFSIQIENITLGHVIGLYTLENKEKKRDFFTKLAKNGHKYYQITETGIKVELDNKNDNDCQNNRPISLGTIKPIELRELN